MSRKFINFIVWAGCFNGILLATEIATLKYILPVRFTENKGQWDSTIVFKALYNGGALFIEKNAWTYHMYDASTYRKWHHAGIQRYPNSKMYLQHHAYQTRFVNANSNVIWNRLNPSNDYDNYFLGSNSKNWVSAVKHYERISASNIYSGIQLELMGQTQGVKYTFTVNPKADPRQIIMEYEGLRRIKLNSNRLVLETSLGIVIEKEPYAYQIISGKLLKIECRYRLRGKRLSFEFPDGYNREFPLVIDPLLVFAAQSGSAADNFGMTATYDASGNLYAGGTAYSIGYPTTLGAFQTLFNGPQNGTDVVITKYSANGSNLLYSTYLGGSNYEVVSSMIVDNNNNLCFYGTTGSSNFPVLANAFDNSFNGGGPLSFVTNGTSFNAGTDIFVSKLSSTGAQLLASTFIGGSQNDGVNHVNHLTFIANTYWEYYIDSLQYNYGDQYRGEIQVDRNNNVYVCSSTRSADFPTLNAFDNSLGGKQDAVVFKFNSGLNQLIFSTYLGGSLNDCGNSIWIRSNDESVYCTGGTCSSDFPVTTGAYATQYLGGKSDAFVIRISSGGNQLLASTFLGSNDYDQGYFIQSDSKNRIYIYGQSMGNFPIVNTGTVAPLLNPGRHQFIARLNPALSGLTKSTVFGNYTTNVDISPSAFAVDRCANMYLSGWGGNIITNGPPLQNMPLMAATQSTTDGFDFYLMGLDSSWVLQYGSYFGGSLSQEHVDGGTSRFDTRGTIYQSACAGCGGHDDFPVTPGAWPNTPGNPNHSGNCNNGVLKIDFQLPLAVATINTSTLSGCAPLTSSLTNATPPLGANATFTWYLGNSVWNTTQLNPVLTFTTPGSYTVSLVVQDFASCNVRDSSAVIYNVLPSPNLQFSVQQSPCSSMVSAFINTVSGQTYSLNWGNGSTTVNPSSLTAISYTASGLYTLTLGSVNVWGCSTQQSQTIGIVQFSPMVSPASSVCSGQSINLTASGGSSYSWQPSLGLSSYTNSSVVFNGLQSTVYTVAIIQQTFGQTCQVQQTVNVSVLPSPTAVVNYSMASCGGGVYFTGAGSSDIKNWNWKFTSTQTSTLQNPYVFFSGGGIQTIQLQVVNAFGCSSVIQKTLNAGSVPPLSITSASYICEGDSARLTAQGGLSYTWIPQESLLNPYASQVYVKPLVNTQYSVVISALSGSSACLYTLTTAVYVDRISTLLPVRAQANPVRIEKGQKSTLMYLGDPGCFVYWRPETQPVSGYTVFASPTTSQVYTLQITKGTCIETRTVLVEVYSAECTPDILFVPNTFTPNNDGINDELKVRCNSVLKIYFAVYNRWGELLFETHDVSKGWDGMQFKNKAEQGVYGWYVEAECINGLKTFKKGNVTLLR